MKRPICEVEQVGYRWKLGYLACWLCIGGILVYCWVVHSFVVIDRSVLRGSDYSLLHSWVLGMVVVVSTQAPLAWHYVGDCRIVFIRKVKKNVHCQCYLSVCSCSHGLCTRSTSSVFCPAYDTHMCTAVHTRYTLMLFCPVVTTSLYLISVKERKKRAAGKRVVMLLLSFAVNLRVLFGCIFLIYKHALK